MTLGTILIIILILILIGAIPAWPYSNAWGYGPSGIVGVIQVFGRQHMVGDMQQGGLGGMGATQGWHQLSANDRCEAGGQVPCRCQCGADLSMVAADDGLLGFVQRQAAFMRCFKGSPAKVGHGLEHHKVADVGQ